MIVGSSRPAMITDDNDRSEQMNRREFLASTTIAGLNRAPRRFGRFAQSKQDTLLVISEGGPNNLDVQGVERNRPGYEVSWTLRPGCAAIGIKTLAERNHAPTIRPPSRPNWRNDGTRMPGASPSICARTPLS